MQVSIVASCQSRNLSSPVVLKVFKTSEDLKDLELFYSGLGNNAGVSETATPSVLTPRHRLG